MKSLYEYKAIIDKNNYDINLIPGIELQFKMNDSKNLEHLIMMFNLKVDGDNDKISIGELEKFLRIKKIIILNQKTSL